MLKFFPKENATVCAFCNFNVWPQFCVQIFYHEIENVMLKFKENECTVKILMGYERSFAY